MTEYDRETNCNTPGYWDSAWSRRDHSTSSVVYEKIAEKLQGLDKARVVEYGFGRPELAEMIGADRWEGRDFSAVAVEKAKEAGYRAYVTRCGDSPGYRKAYLVAVEVLEHLDFDEMIRFLSTSQNAPHAFFSVPVQTEKDAKFRQHQRGFGQTDEEVAGFFRKFWRHVEVERVKERGRMGKWLVHCATKRPPRQPLLTIGCSTLMDFWGANYTLMNLQVQWGHLIDDGTIELVLVDNHPDPGGHAEDQQAIDIMRKLTTDCGGRYVQWCEKQGTYPGKNQLQVEARGKWVLTTDSHVFLSRGTVETVLDLIAEKPESDDFYHLPCLHKPGVMVDHRHLDAIYSGLEWSKKQGLPTYGYTGEMKKPGEPFPIAAMITSAYLVRRAAWFSAKGYDPILGMYGGWEGPLQVKWRLLGRDVVSLRHTTKQPLPLFHWHHFNTRVFNKVFKWAVDGMQSKGKRVRFHTGETKMRNYAASSAVTGGEAWVRRHCELRGWNFDSPMIQSGMKAGLGFRPWMVENLARPEWEDITEFFRWMKAEQIPGHLTRW